MNEAIRSDSLRVIGEEGQQLGVLSRTEALSAAREAGLDLVEVSADSNPPVARIIDWGKFNYQRTKQMQKSRQKSKPLDLKQMRVGLKISDHDLGVKLRKVTEFLDAGHKVRIAVIYRGREMAHRDLGYKLADRVMDELGEHVVREQEPQFAGRQLSFVIRKTGNHAKAKDPPRDQETSQGH
ncbi:MAG TPA: translation initiation factor IF-3 [Candidatus Saccharimonadales bacterium]|nr:translation initiation factor IF-3 [Candidatus Saccharimonadales bacterium]